MRLFSTEQVSKYHPDKVADQISDAILDACLAVDPESHVACETMFKSGIIVLAGEITTKAEIDYGTVAAKTAASLGYPASMIYKHITTQSPQIRDGVGEGAEQGAGDQGMMYGYACSDTDSMLPYGFDLANRIIAAIENDVEKNPETIFKGDAKCQVTVDLDCLEPEKSVRKILISVCHKDLPQFKDAEAWSLILGGAIMRILDECKVDLDGVQLIINPAGAWTIGGPDADCGLTGRKIVCDQYGGYCPVGGGAFSGKDPSKVDRSAAYFARALACHFLEAYGLKECEVQLAYAIGQAQPVSVNVKCVDSSGMSNETYAEMITQDIEENFDLTPRGIIEKLDLLKPRYRELAAGCHYRHNIWRL